MTCFNLNAVMLLTLMLLGAPRAADAAEGYDNCTGFITSLPTTISTQGTWCFNQDLTTAITAGNVITINANNVTIDCNDFKLGGLAAGLGTFTYGIYTPDRLNATVRHCNIRGFFQGLHFDGSGGGHVVEDNRFDNNTNLGLQVAGDGSVVRRNRVFDTGGSTLTGSAIGIVTVDSVDVLDNTVSGVVARSTSNGFATGISTNANPGGSISGNRVRGLLKDGTGEVRGIVNIASGRLTLSNNDLVGDLSANSIGLSCTDANGRATDNVINGFLLGLDVCSNDVGNVIAP